MRNVITIFRKEVATFFNSLVGYVVLAVFLVLAGLFFWVFENGVLTTGMANMDMLFGTAPYLFLFLIPAITMRMFAEEIKSGTIESLMTKPITDWQLIVGKFLAASVVVLIALLPTLVFYGSLAELAQNPSDLAIQQPDFTMLREINTPSYTSRLDHGPIIGAYLGIFSLGVIFVAIGILASALTDNQVVAFILACFLSFIMYEGFSFLAQVESLQGLASTIAGIGIGAHFDSISRGVLDTRDIVYFISVVTALLLATRLVLTLKRS